MSATVNDAIPENASPNEAADLLIAAAERGEFPDQVKIDQLRKLWDVRAEAPIEASQEVEATSAGIKEAAFRTRV